MPQLLALEWNGSEARLAVASSRGDQVLIEQAFAVELRPREPGADKSEVDIGARLAAALALAAWVVWIPWSPSDAPTSNSPAPLAARPRR